LIDKREYWISEEDNSFAIYYNYLEVDTLKHIKKNSIRCVRGHYTLKEVIEELKEIRASIKRYYWILRCKETQKFKLFEGTKIQAEDTIDMFYDLYIPEPFESKEEAVQTLNLLEYQENRNEISRSVFWVILYHDKTYKIFYGNDFCRFIVKSARRNNGIKKVSGPFTYKEAQQYADKNYKSKGLKTRDIKNEFYVVQRINIKEKFDSLENAIDRCNKSNNRSRFKETKLLAGPLTEIEISDISKRFKNCDNYEIKFKSGFSEN
jgi:hypothetical protein